MIMTYLNNIEKMFKRSYILSFIGFIILSYLLWNRLIRVRLPKDLPFILQDYQVLLLLIMCFCLLISLYFTIISILNFKIIINPITQEVVQFYIESLCQLDFIIKFSNITLWKTLKIYHRYLLITLRDNQKTQNIFLLFELIKIIPPILLLLLLPMISNYIYYSLHLFYVRELEKLNEILDIRIQEEINSKITEYAIKNNAAHYFIQETTMERLGKRNNIPTFRVLLNKEYMKKNPKQDFEKVFSFYYFKVLSVMSDYYAILHNIIVKKQKYIHYINMFSLTILTFSWVYVFLTSKITFTPEFISFWIEIFTKI